jgi:beta-galactosidase
VLAETGLFGSAGGLTFTEEISWQRFSEHYDAMILRDRNHPSVFGWSFGNEIFNIFDRSNMRPEDKDKYYAKLSEFGRSGSRLDPTREWISCDGDEDLRGTMPVWAKHYGHGVPNRLPTLNKPMMVGESGGTYYATPAQLATFNGERAYESYAGRNEALGFDVYQNIVQMARPRLAYFSPSELSWFGIEHLPLGYSDFTRLPTQKDGVFFKPFEEGKPGMQPERIAPYCTALNPGYDPALPLYRALGMFEAMKAALAKDGPRPLPWDPKATPLTRPPATNDTPVVLVDFLGDRAGSLFTTMNALDVPFGAATGESNAGLLLVDGESLTTEMAQAAKPRVDALLARGGLVLVCFHRPGAEVAPVNLLLPAPVSLTTRQATALNRGEDHPWNTSFSLANLYFAEINRDKQVVKCGLDGDFVRSGKVVFKASNTDWFQFNRVTESAKCGAAVLYEQLNKPSGAALVQAKQGLGTIAISTIEYAATDGAYTKLWSALLHNMGVKLGKRESGGPAPGAPTKPAGDILLDGPKN